ncbi:uncharacterized protein LOC143915856 [Arctopsyche grandis]|uniref:uncharacterized protein LOC143915856 n=1 Tax=Arctopsyche grandis TaxID=121162 RepID=UPI00406D763D
MKSAQFLVLVGFLYKIILIRTVNCDQYFESSQVIPGYNNHYQPEYADCKNICATYENSEHSMYQPKYCNCQNSNDQNNYKQYIWEDVTNKFQYGAQGCPYQAYSQSYPAYYSEQELYPQNAYQYSPPTESLHNEYRSNLDNAYNQNYHYIEPDSVPMQQYDTDHGQYYIMKDNIPILRFSSNLLNVEAVYVPKERESQTDELRNLNVRDNTTETTLHIRSSTTISTTERTNLTLNQFNSTTINKTHNATERANNQDNILSKENSYGMKNLKQYKRHVSNGTKSITYNREEFCKALGKVGIQCDSVFRQINSNYLM